jgi:prepilin-type N-terminal cleavage/methylation domain-containing protein
MSEKGMTLIEVLVTVLILSMLASIATLSVSFYLNEGKTRMAQGDLATLKAAVRLYILDKGSVPADLNTLVVTGYLPELPKDPFVAVSTDYRYDTSDPHNIYIYSVGPNGSDDSHGPDDIVVSVNIP